MKGEEPSFSWWWVGSWDACPAGLLTISAALIFACLPAFPPSFLSLRLLLSLSFALPLLSHQHFPNSQF